MMMTLALINAINAKKYVTLVPERVHVGITYRLLIIRPLNGYYRTYYRNTVHITFYL